LTGDAAPAPAPALTTVAGVPAPLAPLAFLLGTWRGEGVGGYEGMEGFRYLQEVTFSCDGRPFLSYVSRTWLLGTLGGRVEGTPLATETGFWRMGVDETAGTSQVEVMLAHPFGIAEIYVGTVTGTKIDLDSNVVIRTSTARDVNRSVRLYGRVDGDLAYAVDMAAEGKPLQSHLSARLSPVTDGSTGSRGGQSPTGGG
jgi:hypothetical protein